MIYSEKLKDPRWQRKRLEIMSRDDFSCQLCGEAEKTLHVHHRKYLNGNDPWDYPSKLLITVCESCHTAIHEPLPKMRIYLAGKISKWCWRHKIVRELRSVSHDAEGKSFGEISLRNAVIGRHDYAGPFFISCDHGCSHKSGFHGVKETECTEVEARNSGRNAAYKNCLQNIRNSTVVFAWLDEPDAYGTIFEIGYASALNKPIVIGTPYGGRDDMWFAMHDAFLHVNGFGPINAFRRFIQFVEKPQYRSHLKQLCI